MRHIDQLGIHVNLSGKPCRVISLVPSQSEFLWDIGLKEELVGISKFCIHPDEMFKTIERVGGTKELNLKKIRQLKPDLIIGNKEENEKSQIEALQKEFNVWLSDIVTFEDAFDMMRKLAVIFGKEKEAESILSNLHQTLPKIKNVFEGQRVLYFIWNKPYMLVGKNTFIDFVLNYVGLKNALESLERYPQQNEVQLAELSPDYCFLSSEPFPFSDKHSKEIKQFLPKTKMVLVDGEMFSWYGSRLLYLEGYIRKLKQQLRS